MKYLIDVVCYLLLVLMGLSHGYGQSSRQVDNITSFGELFGYIRYFQPSDEASNIDWNRFAIYGCRQVEQCRSRRELKDSLLTLFSAIAPTLKIFEGNETAPIDIDALTPENMQNFKIIAWQHLGVNTGNTEGRAKSAYNVYKSARTNRPSDSGLLFGQYPKVGELMRRGIGSNLTIFCPLALYGSTNQTFPVADKSALMKLNTAIKRIPDNTNTGNNLYTRLAGIVISWNIFQHFFPYFKQVDTD